MGHVCCFYTSIYSFNVSCINYCFCLCIPEIRTANICRMSSSHLWSLLKEHLPIMIFRSLIWLRRWFKFELVIFTSSKMWLYPTQLLPIIWYSFNEQGTLTSRKHSDFCRKVWPFGFGGVLFFHFLFFFNFDFCTFPSYIESFIFVAFFFLRVTFCISRVK